MFPAVSCKKKFRHDEGPLPVLENDKKIPALQAGFME